MDDYIIGLAERQANLHDCAKMIWLRRDIALGAGRAGRLGCVEMAKPATPRTSGRMHGSPPAIKSSQRRPRRPDCAEKKGVRLLTWLLVLLVRRKRFELLTPWFVAKYSIQLSYRRMSVATCSQGYICCKPAPVLLFSSPINNGKSTAHFCTTTGKYTVPRLDSERPNA